MHLQFLMFTLVASALFLTKITNGASFKICLFLLGYNVKAGIKKEEFPVPYPGQRCHLHDYEDEQEALMGKVDIKSAY